MALQYQKSQTDPLFRLRDILALYMTEPPNSSELDIAAVESNAFYLMYEVKTTDCTT